MRKHLRKMITVLLAVSLLLSLTSCLDSDFLSDSEESDTSYSAGETDSESSEEATNDDESTESEDEYSESEDEEFYENTAINNNISFETTDLDGNTVKSDDIFGEYRITMINIWGTFCGPCIGEMPELEKLSKSISEKNCGVMGVVCDIYGANDSDTISSAKEIINSTGVTYVNVIPWKDIDDKLPSEFVPTTYFVDSNGNVVGNVMIGAHYAIDYEKEIDDILDKMD